MAARLAPSGSREASGTVGPVPTLAVFENYIKGLLAETPLKTRAGVIATMYLWWHDVIHEANTGDHTPVVQLHLRYGMILFIASEVMFVLAWFWAFFDSSLFPSAVEKVVCGFVSVKLS